MIIFFLMLPLLASGWARGTGLLTTTGWFLSPRTLGLFAGSTEISAAVRLPNSDGVIVGFLKGAAFEWDGEARFGPRKNMKYLNMQILQ